MAAAAALAQMGRLATEANAYPLVQSDDSGSYFGSSRKGSLVRDADGSRPYSRSASLCLRSLLLPARSDLYSDLYPRHCAKGGVGGSTCWRASSACRDLHRTHLHAASSSSRSPFSSSRGIDFAECFFTTSGNIVIVSTSSNPSESVGRRGCHVRTLQSRSGDDGGSYEHRSLQDDVPPAFEMDVEDWKDSPRAGSQASRLSSILGVVDEDRSRLRRYDVKGRDGRGRGGQGQWEEGEKVGREGNRQRDPRRSSPWTMAEGPKQDRWQERGQNGQSYGRGSSGVSEGTARYSPNTRGTNGRYSDRDQRSESRVYGGGAFRERPLERTTQANHGSGRGPSSGSQESLYRIQYRDQRHGSSKYPDRDDAGSGRGRGSRTGERSARRDSAPPSSSSPDWWFPDAPPSEAAAEISNSRISLSSSQTSYTDSRASAGRERSDRGRWTERRDGRSVQQTSSTGTPPWKGLYEGSADRRSDRGGWQERGEGRSVQRAGSAAAPNWKGFYEGADRRRDTDERSSFGNGGGGRDERRGWGGDGYGGPSFRERESSSSSSSSSFSRSRRPDSGSNSRSMADSETDGRGTSGGYAVRSPLSGRPRREEGPSDSDRRPQEGRWAAPSRAQEAVVDPNAPKKKPGLWRTSGTVSPPSWTKAVKQMDPPGPFLDAKALAMAKKREEYGVQGEPLTPEEVKELVKDSLTFGNRQVNLGRDGLTHNMVDNIHTHWKRRRVCKTKCKGVPTVDMNGLCKELEEKTGGRIIYRAGGVLFLFRGRYYDYKKRPKIEIKLWKDPAPKYPPLIQRAPEGLTSAQAYHMRMLGRKLDALCKLTKNGVYTDLVKTIQWAFQTNELLRISAKGLNKSDYKKIGARLRSLVPCVLISFKDENIIIWRGRDWKSPAQRAAEAKVAAKAEAAASGISGVSSSSASTPAEAEAVGTTDGIAEMQDNQELRDAVLAHEEELRNAAGTTEASDDDDDASEQSESDVDDGGSEDDIDEFGYSEEAEEGEEANREDANGVDISEDRLPGADEGNV